MSTHYLKNLVSFSHGKEKDTDHSYRRYYRHGSDRARIANAIALNYDKYDGFVVLHGTDTLAYSASALSFMLEGLDKPVVFTGAQIPLCELRSDGYDNLITSMMIAADDVIREVSLCFGDAILRGNRAIKYSADGMVAFTSPNFNKLADAGINIEYNHAAINEYMKSSIRSDAVNFVRLRESRIAVIKIVPGIQFDIFEPIMCESLEGLVLETFGKGNIPDYDPALSRIISDASRCGTIVVVCTQCPAGTVSLGTYEAGATLVKAGAVSGGSMTTEAAFTKLMYLLSKNLPKDEIRRLMQTDLRGELAF